MSTLSLTDWIAQWRAELRPGQRALADWQGGELAVSAVPGAGKSTGLAAAAAIAIARYGLSRQKQLVLVTLTRTAVANLRRKIVDRLRAARLPLGGFSVTTLHSLALTLARSHPTLSGWDDEATLLWTEAQKKQALRQAVSQWLEDCPHLWQELVYGCGFDGEDTERLRRETVLRSEVLPAIAKEALVGIKSTGLTVAELEDSRSFLLQLAGQLYTRYEALQRAAGAIDYDDMTLGALQVLREPAVRAQWQAQTFAVFEDEAQDSTPLQAQLLEILAADADGQRHLVRVGDPNQSINASFTAADPRFFREFCDRCGQQNRLVVMDQAGRSSPEIIAAANALVRWANASVYSQPLPPFRLQTIRPVPPTDRQRNPVALGPGVEIHRPDTIQTEVQALGDGLQPLLQANPDLTAAILVRHHQQARYIAKHLPKTLNLYDAESRERRSQIPAELLKVLQFLGRPHSPDRLRQTLEVLRDRQLIPPGDLNAWAAAPEAFLYPTPLDPAIASPARQKCIGLLQARLQLPVSYLLPFVALTLDYDASELAATDQLGQTLHSQLRGRYDLPTLIATLAEGVLNNAFTTDDETEPLEERYMQPGRVTLTTLHKAKGLEWDVVCIPFLHERTCPGSFYVSEPQKFLGDYNWAEALRTQLRALAAAEPLAEPKGAWEQHGQLKQSEELRLLYVGVTRAKRRLWLSAARRGPLNWHAPDKWEDLRPSPALSAFAPNGTGK
ncbi:MAG: ATP-dependent helicase [Pseudanabaenaceae cyanobacterium]